MVYNDAGFTEVLDSKLTEWQKDYLSKLLLTDKYLTILSGSNNEQEAYALTLFYFEECRQLWLNTVVKPMANAYKVSVRDLLRIKFGLPITPIPEEVSTFDFGDKYVDSVSRYMKIRKVFVPLTLNEGRLKSICSAAPMVTELGVKD